MPFLKPLSITCLIAIAGTASAAEPTDLFKALDKNKDGMVTKDEVGAISKRHFDRMLRLGDRNFDGKLTLDEFKFGATEPQSAPTPSGQLVGRGRDRNIAKNFDPSRAFQFLDRNGDGKLKYEELPEQAQRRMKPLFDRIGKETITKEEFSRFSQLRSGNSSQSANSRRSQEIKKAESIAKNQTASKAKSENRAKDDSKKPASRFGNGRSPVSYIFGRYDSDKNGSLSKAEAPERMKQNFDRIDGNDDGEISKTEIESLFSRMQQRSKKPNQK